MQGGEVIFRFKGNTNDLDNKVNNATKNIQKKTSLTASVTKGSIISSGISKAFNTISSSLDRAITRFDQMNNFPNTMKNLGIGTKEAKKAIQTLSDKLTGLPTALDTATMSVSRLVSKNGDINKSTKMYLAMNNAILAGGASMEIQTSAMEQMTQAYSKGKPDMIEWKSMLTAMPGQIKQVATAMGMSVDDLGDDLRKKGGMSMDEFIDKIVELDTKGVKGFASFEEQARNATGGVATSITNMKTAVARGIANVMTAIDQGLASTGLGSISTIIQNTGKSWGNALSNIAKVAPSIIQTVYKLRGGFIALAVAVGLYKTAINGIGTANKLMTTLNTIQKSRIQWKLLTMEMRGASNSAIIFNKNISDTQKLMLLIRKLNIGDKFASIGSGALSASQGLGKFIASHKMLSIASLGIIGVLAGLGIALYKTGGDFSKITEKVKSVISNIMNVAKNIFSQLGPILTQVFNSISTFITTNLPKILPAIAKFLTNTLPNMITSASKTISTVITKLGETLPQIIEQLTVSFSRIVEAELPKLIKTFTDIFLKIVQTATTVLPKLITSISKILPQIIKTISTGLTTLVTSLVSMIPVILPPLTNGLMTLVTSLVGVLPKVLPTLIQGILTLVVALIGGLVVIIGPLVKALIQASITIIEALVKALPQIIMALVEAIPQVFNALVNGLISAVPVLISGAIQLIGVLVKSIPQIIVALIKAVPTIVKSLATTMVNNWRLLFSVGVQLIKKLWAGFKSWISQLLSNVKNFAKSIPTKIKTAFTNIKNVGKNLVQGLWYGIKNAKNWVLDKVKGFGKSILEGLKNIFKTHSPSEETFDIGVNVDQGFVNGIMSMKRDIDTAFNDTFGLSPQLTKTTSNNYSPTVNVINNVSVEQDPLGQMVKKIKTFSGGAKNDYNYGMGV